MEIDLWMLLVPAVLSAGAIPLRRRGPVLAWAVWGVMAVLTVVGAVLFGAAIAFLQTLVGDTRDALRGEFEPAGSHVDLTLLLPWVVAAVVVLAGTAVAVRRVRPGRTVSRRSDAGAAPASDHR